MTEREKLEHRKEIMHEVAKTLRTASMDARIIGVTGQQALEAMSRSFDIEAMKIDVQQA